MVIRFEKNPCPLNLITPSVIALTHLDAIFIALQSEIVAFIGSSNVTC
jgi:hypothetical protein